MTWDCFKMPRASTVNYAYVCLIVVCTAQRIYGLSGCGAGSTMCRGVRKCVSDQQRCDGVNNCGDWSDEDTCPGFTCPGNQFHCTDGPCIDGSWRCDGSDDCDDGSDESGCSSDTTECGIRSSMCRSVRRCVSDDRRCDGVNDCGDWSDEDTCPDFKCPRSGFRCLNGPCIPPGWVCDGEEDCTDGSDEHACPNLHQQQQQQQQQRIW